MDPKQQFYSHFHDEVSAIENLISQIPAASTVTNGRQAAIDNILTTISRLQNEVADASDDTPAYDRRQYSQTIKSLQDKLNDAVAASAPKSRFQFKRNAAAPKVVDKDPRMHPVFGSSTVSTSADSITPKTQESPTMATTGLSSKDYNSQISLQSSSLVRKPSFSTAKSIDISKHSGLQIIIPKSASGATAAASITDISNCIVDMSTLTAAGHQFQGLALRNIRNSLIVGARVRGPVHITGITDSILVISAHQVRIHDCKNVDLYLYCSSHPIIEDCSGMRFGPLPSYYEVDADVVAQNQWSEVDDFKWLKATASPNWSIIPQAELRQDESWAAVTTEHPDANMEQILKAFGISKP